MRPASHVSSEFSDLTRACIAVATLEKEKD